MKKKFGLIMLCAVVMLFTISPSYAADAAKLDSQRTVDVEINAEKASPVVLENFVDYISDFFNDTSTWHAVDKNGNDISDTYYKNNYAYYKSGEYETLMQNTEGVVDCLERYVYSEALDQANFAQSIEPNAAVSKQASRIFNCLPIKGLLLYNYEMQVSLTGNYEVDIVNGIVTKTSLPIVVCEDYTYKNYGTGYISNIQKTHYISANHTTAIFYTTFDLYRDYDSGIEYGGSIYLQVVGGINGYISSNPSSGEAQAN